MTSLLCNVTPRIVHKTLFRCQSGKVCPPKKAAPIHKDGGYKIYKMLTFLVFLPACAVVGARVFMHKQTEDECEHRPPFVKYETMRRRTKRFPWGDGNKSLFHNPKVNPLPNGYEDELPPSEDSK